MKELTRALKPGRYIYAEVDSLFTAVRHAVNARHDLEVASKTLRDERFRVGKFGFHFWAFTPKSLEELFRSADLQATKVVGKPVLYDRRAERLLQDPEKVRKLLELELALREEESIIWLWTSPAHSCPKANMTYR